MNNPFQDQFLKAGLVTKQQVKSANQDKNRKRKQQPQAKKKPPQLDPATIKARQAAEQKAQRDRDLNQKKQEQARKKAISAEINQLITQNLIKRDEQCDIVYNFEHQQKIRRIYVNADLRQKLIQGKLGIARIDGRYELVPLPIAQKIQQRNEMRVVIFEPDEKTSSDQDPYADFEVPDDLMW